MGGTFFPTSGSLPAKQRHGTRSERRQIKYKKTIASERDLDASPFFQVIVFGLLLLCSSNQEYRLSIRNMRRWCIGNIEASQALAPGSTPGRRIYIFFDFGKKESVFEGRIELPTFCV